MNRPAPGICSKCRILRVIDGDTVEVELVTHATVRLLDCWAPESRTLDLQEKHKGIGSKNNLIELAEGKEGIVHIPTATAHSVGDVLTMGRVLGKIWIDGQPVDLSTAQVLAGHATATKAG